MENCYEFSEKYSMFAYKARMVNDKQYASDE